MIRLGIGKTQNYSGSNTFLIMIGTVSMIFNNSVSLILIMIRIWGPGKIR